MARDTAVRLQLTGTLVCRTPVHVGGAGDDPDTDLPVARDGKDRCYLPGTSLTGALRDWCRAAFAEPTDTLWGFQKGDDGHASYVTVDDVYVPDAALVPEVRDGVGIDRVTGAAATGLKYDRAVLPRGTELPDFAVTAEVPADRERLALAALAGLRDTLAPGGRFHLGAARTRGLGRVELRAARLTRVRLTDRDDMFALLRNKNATDVPAADIAAARADHPARPAPRLRIEIVWRAVGPVMVKAGFDGIAADMLPLVSALPGGVAPVLPGSSVKGALRARAEQIVRTLTDTPADGDVLTNLDVPLVEEVFGSRGREKTTLGRGAVTVADCYAAGPLSADAWSEIATAGDAKLRAALNTARPDWQQAFHVAIDRWTGGAAEGMLYTVLEPHGTAWEPLDLDIDLARTSPAGVALLLLVLRDLKNGRLPLGFGVNRGLGAVAVDRVTVTPETAGAEYGATAFDLSTVPPGVKAAWAAWVAGHARGVTP